MKDFFLQLKEKFSGREIDEEEIAAVTGEDYVELSAGGSNKTETQSKVIVRPFVMEDFEDIKPVLDSLREGHTVALINIKPLKDKDLVILNNK